MGWIWPMGCDSLVPGIDASEPALGKYRNFFWTSTQLPQHVYKVKYLWTSLLKWWKKTNNSYILNKTSLYLFNPCFRFWPNRKKNTSIKYIYKLNNNAITKHMLMNIRNGISVQMLMHYLHKDHIIG